MQGQQKIKKLCKINPNIMNKEKANDIVAELIQARIINSC